MTEQIKELRAMVLARKSIPGYEYRPRHDNWLLRVECEYERANRKRRSIQHDTCVGKRLYVATQDTMLSLIEEAFAAYRDALAQYEEKLQECLAVKRERSTFSEMVAIVKSLERDFMTTDLGKEISAMTDEMSEWHEEYNGELTVETANQKFAELKTWVAAQLPEEMRVIGDAPLTYDTPPTVTIEWRGRSFEVAVCGTNQYDWWVEFSVRMPEQPTQPVAPSLLSSDGVLKLNYGHPSVEIITFNYERTYESRDTVWIAS